jgi:hypothetical protein
MNRAMTAVHRCAAAAYTRRLLRRALLLWAPLRVLLFVLAMLLRLDPTLSPAGTLMLAAAVAVLCHVDGRFMRETIFHANLGTPTWAPAAAGFAVSLGAELVIGATVMRVLG